MLSRLLYQVGMGAFEAAMTIGASFSPKIKRGLDGRKGLIEKLESALPALSKGRDVAWFHAASLGEFEQGRPVIEEFRKNSPTYFIILTFFSPSGFEVRKNYNGADYICYLPLDNQSNAKRFVQALNPKIAFFIKYEFWYNYLRELRENGTHIVSFSTIFRPEQIFFKFYGGFHRNILNYFDQILVQNESSLKLLNSIGFSKCQLAGDTRFDRVNSIATGARELPEVVSFVGNSPCLVAGSVWQADMDVLIPSLNAVTPALKAIIAPHEIDMQQMESWRKLLTGRTVLYSEYLASPEEQTFDYLIIDNVGMLSSLYRYGSMAFIGGAFGAGLHNILEAATFHLPIIFGNKKFHKFQEAVDLLELGGAIAVSDASGTTSAIENLMTDKAYRQKMGTVSRQYVQSHTGATGRVIAVAESLLERNV
jgi:3-deoxy-D-manno-octulosonic-acid transferase